MGSLGFSELIIILLIVILIFGAKRLPDLGRGIGGAIKNFRAATKDGLAESDEEDRRPARNA